MNKSDSKTTYASDSEDELFCPLCVEEIDLADKNFLPCPCGYRVCMWCWHHIRENLNGLCPACRTPYKEDPHAFAAVDRQEIVKKNREKRQKEKLDKKVPDAPLTTGTTGAASSSSATIDRKLLHNFRVVQRNLVYVIGIPASIVSTDEALRKPELFGQYGKIGKVVVHRNTSHSSAHNTVSAYVTFVHKEDAKAAIQALDGHWLDSTSLLRASFGTTKYCNNFVRGVACSNPECVYLHEIGDDEDRFTKEEIQAGHSKLAPTAGTNQMVVTGNGGPSGTGKKPAGEPILPPPVFVQDLPLERQTSVTSTVPLKPPSVVTASINSSNSSTASPNTSISNSSTGIPSASSFTNLPTSDTGNNSTSNANASLPAAGAVARSTSWSTAASGKLSVGNSPATSGNTIANAGNATNNVNTVSNSSSPQLAPSKEDNNHNSASDNASANLDTYTEIGSQHNFLGSLSGSIGQVSNAAVSATGYSSSQNFLSTTNVQSNDLNTPATALSGSTSSASLTGNDVTSGLSPADMLSPLQRLASSARTEASRNQVAASAFNGLGSSTVFPVPVSSLSISVWSYILTNAGNTLEVNPYEKLQIPISELMDLTLPPVDAVGTQPWPKPLAYYRKGIDPILPSSLPSAASSSPILPPAGQLSGPGLGQTLGQGLGPVLGQGLSQQLGPTNSLGQTNNLGLNPGLGQSQLAGLNNQVMGQGLNVSSVQQSQQQQALAHQRQQLLRQQEMYLRNQQLQQSNVLQGQASQQVNGSSNIGNSQSVQQPIGNNLQLLQQMFPQVQFNQGATINSSSMSSQIQK